MELPVHLAYPRTMLAAAAIALASTTLVTVYALMLSRAGMSATAAPLLVVLLASTLSSIAGFAFSAICGAMLLQLINDPVRVVEIMMVCSIAIQSLSVAVLRRDIDWRRLAPFLAGGAVGVPFGVELLLHLGHGGFRQVIGGLLTIYAAYVLLKRPLTVAVHGTAIDVGVGFLGGITGGLAGFPGAAVTIWCGMRGWDKQRQRGIYQPFILIMQVLGVVLIEVIRMSSARGQGPGLPSLQFVPVALLGTWFGLAIFRRLSDRVFTCAVNLLLLASGIGLLI
ncbi:MAG TPA: sulfite exporter TauE/SafE family protein [Acetobacteraceae bacterium]|nr:sulfite exporter TauE/SafE family protein [Acetobacteraceae bacterium]